MPRPILHRSSRRPRPLAGPLAGSLSGLLPTLLLAAPLALIAGCGGEDDAGTGDGMGLTDDGGPKTESVLRRERVAVHFAKEEWNEALEELEPLLSAKSPVARDLVTQAQIALRLGDFDLATSAVEKAAAVDAEDPAVLYTKARLAVLDGDTEAAIAAFEAVLRAAPDDAASKLGLADAIVLEAETDEDYARARGLLEEVAALGLPNGLQWYVTSVYRRWRLALEADEPEEVVVRWETLWNDLGNEKGFKPASESDLDPGDLARVAPPEATGSYPDGDPALPVYGEPRVLATLGEGVTSFKLADMDGDRLVDILSVTDGKLTVTTRDREGGVRGSAVVVEGVTGPYIAIDLNQGRGGDTLDVVAATGTTLTIMEQSDELDAAGWERSPVAFPDLGGAIRDIEPVDHDHDGDLDLLVVGDFGARLFMNAGAGAIVDPKGQLLERGTWEDVSELATLPAKAMTWCVADDFDNDNDVDLLVGGPSGAHLMDSQRRGLFTDRGAELFPSMAFPREPAVADIDGDARPDLFVPDAASSRVLHQQADGTFVTIPLRHGLVEGAVPVLTDLDLDGTVDVAWSGPDGAGRAVLALALDKAAAVDLPEIAGARGPLTVAEVDVPDPYADLALDLVTLRGADLVALSPESGFGNSVYLKFIGKKDNRQGVGAVVEVRAGKVYRRIYLRGGAEIVGIGKQEYVDVVRVTWPNGAINQETDVEKGAQTMLDNDAFAEQQEALIGSCPFLYTWNGTTFEFISDVIGITPLGLPMAPGMLVPPDHDEYVLVRGDQLVPDANGELVMQFTEELREVTYLDRARLDVVDHPEGTKIYPNERFKFPPFPEPHTHTISSVAKVARATGSDGKDWTAELQEQDFRHPRPFARLGGQYLGLAEPHWLELEFDPKDLEGAKLLRLVATGWFYWSDASVNMAAATTPGIGFVPPILEVPGPDGTWVPAGPPIGFPAGKTKTMVVDVTDIVPREDPRLRIGSTLELYWDEILLATCDDDAEIRTHPLEPVGADLWSRGFSKPIEPDRPDLPLFFDWELVESRPRWNQHPGQYTRFGEVNALLGEIDDRYVIMGSGDALTLRFDATALPPVPEGYVRDYLVFLDGWAKDRDPNTHEALEVEPLPFHGMSGYPYGEDEAFPDTQEHRQWRREWNTRPGHQWIIPLSPAREKEWVDAILSESGD